MTATPYIKLRMRDGILFCTYSDNLEIGLEIAKHCVKARIELAKGKAYPVLIDGRGVRFITKEARDYLGKEGSAQIIAGAMIVGSPLTQMLGNIFMRLNRPASPARLFTDEEAAKIWLQKFIIYDHNKGCAKRRTLSAVG